ncbi:MAG: ATP-binding cassette domain-containing protein [Bacteroidota bacterium]|nr:ATP-binding cassette domain-containing protein [Candidatus Kapabacteria bacterium]MDW8075890.1 ATP-binding cassette domain-containing protein [Bacteroidota bacterium]
MAFLEVQGVVKRYGRYLANDQISFSVEQGRLFGVLGPNGAGKTTLLRMITRIILPDEGSILLEGQPLSAEHQRRIGYVPEERGLYRNLTVLDNLQYFGQLKGLSRTEATAQALHWLAFMETHGWEKKKVRELSKGMSQKVQFIAAVLHRPSLLVLDEPFSGLDPINVEVFLRAIDELRSQGTTILFSTHVMEQAEQMCEDIVLINRGRIVESGRLRDIKARFGIRRFELDFEGDSRFLEALPPARILSCTDHSVAIALENGFAEAQQIIAWALERTTIRRAECIEPSLREIFIETVRRSQSEEVPA